MSSIVSRRPPATGSVSHSNDLRWISMRLGTSRTLFRRAKLRRVRGASTRGKTATPRGVDSWGLLEASGARLAFVLADQHPSHVAWRVSGAQLEHLAAENGSEITTHRDGSRSFYLEAPGGNGFEVIAYPDAADEDAE